MTGNHSFRGSASPSKQTSNVPSLSDAGHMRRFVARLEKAEAYCKTNRSSQWEDQFVADMREKFESREVMADLGVTPWSPTASQWNTLGEISQRG